MKIKYLIIWIIVFLISGYFVYFFIENNNYKQDRAKLTIGIYKLDISRTNLGIYNDSLEYYKDLTIEFKKNKTFRLNKQVPFIADTTGIWKVGGMNRWNEIYYKKDLDKSKKLFGDQISVTYLDKSDSIMYINSVTPRFDQLRKSDVTKVYFKKIW